MDGTIENVSTNDSSSIQMSEEMSTPEVKKNKEFEKVVDWFSRVKRGEQGREVVVIEGNPGEKKRELLQELLNEFDSCKARVVRLTAERIACSHQLSVVYDFFAQLFCFCNKASNKGDIGASVIKGIPTEQLNLIGNVFPTLYDLLGIDKPGEVPSQGFVKTRPIPLTDHRLGDALADLNCILTSKLAPVCFLFEDLHWACPLLLQFMHGMFRRCSASPHLAVLSYVRTSEGGASDLVDAISKSPIPSHHISIVDGPDGVDKYIRLVCQKIENLPADSITILKVASLLGIRFRSVLLEEVYCAIDHVHRFDLTTPLNLKNSSDKAGVVQKALREFLSGHLFAKVSRWYQFLDDAVFDAVLRLLDADPNGAELVFKVGRVLHHLSSQDRNLLLPSVIHMNSAANILPQNSPPFLAQLNLDAAEQAMEVTSFSLAVDYANQGLEFLGADMWQTEYRLVLDLTTALAEMALADLNFIECKAAIDEVVRNARSVGDKIPVYYILLDSLRAQGRFAEGIKIGLKVLPLIGEKTKYATSLRKIRIQFNKNAANVSDRPQLLNTELLEICKLLQHLGEMAWSNDDPSGGIQMLSRVALISLKFGPNQYSALAFAAIGVSFRLHNFLDESIRAGRLALALDERFPSSSTALTGALVHKFIDHWHRPYGTGVQLLSRAYADSQNRGCTDNAFFSATVELTLRQLCGESLADLNMKCSVIVRDATMYGQTDLILKILPQYQFQLNLTGAVRVVHVLSGSGMQEESYLAMCTEINHHLCDFYFQKMMLAYFFGSYVKANEYKHHFLQHAAKYWCVQATVPVAMWFGGLIAVEMYKSTSNKAFLRDAKKDLKQMQKWVKSGFANVMHRMLLLEAEIAAATTSSTAPALFRKAVESAASASYLQDQALAYERAAINSLFESDTLSAIDLMVEASRMYKQWGATAKVTQIITKYPYLFYDQITVVSSSKSNRKDCSQGVQ